MSQHQITRVKHELKRRTLSVGAVERLTPNMVRVTLTSPELRDFTSAAPDDHIKLFFPTGPAEAGGEPPTAMRDFTPRRFDTARGELIIDFALHDAGPATAWAAQAAPGQTLRIGGPRGSTVVPDDFDWYLLIGDETALPAIARRAEEIRPQARIITLAAVTGTAEEQKLSSRAPLEAHWIHRPAAAAHDPEPFLSALAKIQFPSGDGFIFIAAEGGVARALRAYVTEQRGHSKTWVKASGYWKRGQAETHEKIED
jgi:NADPH-dependent ferric siderophore reductase